MRPSACVVVVLGLACNTHPGVAVDASSTPVADASSPRDASSAPGAGSHDAPIADVSSPPDASSATTVYYVPCSQFGDAQGVRATIVNDQYDYALTAVTGDFAVAAAQDDSVQLMEDDSVECLLQPSVWTCTNMPNFGGATSLNGYDMLQNKLLSICSGPGAPAQFGNQVVIWGDNVTPGAGSTSYSAIANPITCSQTATLVFYAGTSNSDTRTIQYELVSVPSGERAIVAPHGVNVVTAYKQYGGDLGATCGSSSMCTGQPTGARTTDLLGNVFFGGQLAVICSATDTSSAGTIVEGSGPALVVEWSDL